VLSENIFVQNNLLMTPSSIPKPSVYQPPMSVDTALKKKVSLGKAKEFRLPMPVDTFSKPMNRRRSSLGENSPRNEFVNHKVFQKRYNTAATTIQRVLRGFFARSQVAQTRSAIHTQILVRQRLQDRANQKQAASVMIQARVRGWRCRLRIQVYKLEHKLRMIEQRKERDMLDLLVWKEQEMERIRQSAQSLSEEVNQKICKNQEMLEKADKIIKYLRKENKKLRDKNDALQVAINLLWEENKIMEKQTLEYKVFSERMNDMLVVDHENKALTGLLAQCEERKVEFEEAIVCRDERIMFENKVGRLYLNGIQAIVLAIEDACVDDDLVSLVEELCLHCNIPGSGCGLDETELDISERMLH
jgi:hypothetical protein